MTLAHLISYGLSVSVLLTIGLMGYGRKRRRIGYIIGFVSQLAWIWYVTLLVPQYGLLLMEVPLVFIYGRHVLRGD